MFLGHKRKDTQVARFEVLTPEEVTDKTGRISQANPEYSEAATALVENVPVGHAISIECDDKADADRMKRGIRSALDSMGFVVGKEYIRARAVEPDSENSDDPTLLIISKVSEFMTHAELRASRSAAPAEEADDDEDES